MTHITIFPDQLSTMSEAELALLPAEQLFEVHLHLAQLVEWVKKAQAKTHSALQRRYAQREQDARIHAAKDFGAIHLQDGPLRVTVDAPKRVSWDQTQLAEMARRIAASGDRVEDYLDVEFSVSESRFNNWPSTLREQFAAARTVKPGKRTYELTRSPESEVV